MDKRKKIETVQDAVNGWKQYGDHVAVRFTVGDSIVEKNYADIHCDVKKISAFLTKKGLSQNIALIGENSYEWICMWFGIVNAGGTAVTINKDLNEADILDHVLFADCTAVIYSSGVADKIQICMKKTEKDSCAFFSFDDLMKLDPLEKEAAETQTSGTVQPDDIATILYTSGTTGRSKAVMLSHKNLLNNYFGSFTQEDYRNFNHYLITPFHHIMSLASIIVVLAEGGMISISLSVKYFIQDLTALNPTELVLVPQIVRMLCEYIERKKNEPLNFVSHIKYIFSGGGTLSLSDWDMLKERNITVLQAYGATETAGAGLSGEMTEETSTRLGKPSCNITVSVVEDEIVLKGSSIMKGYYKNPEETALVLQGDAFYTGDLGYIDEEGYVHITGRKKNLIILSNGENINPEEIERKLNTCREIREIMVMEMKNQLCAEIFPAETDDKEAQRKKIEKFVKEYNIQVPIYRQIRKLMYREEEFEKTPTNKIKRELKKGK